MKTPVKNISYKIIFVFFLCLIVVLPAMNAWATFVAPKRVMMEDKQRTAKLTIHNGTDKSMVYRFEWEHRAQLPDGKVLLLKEGETVPGYRPAEDMLQFSPRQVILESGKSQRIRFLARRSVGLSDGEYHSHFLIKTEPMVDILSALASSDKSGMTGTVTIRSNVSIPVFLRQGKTHVDIVLNEARLVQKEGKNFIHVQLSNNSTRSLYIKPVLECGAGDNATSIVIQTIKLYTEAKSINDDIPVPKAFDLSQCSNLTLKLLGTDDFEYRRKVITQADVLR